MSSEPQIPLDQAMIASGGEKSRGKEGAKACLNCVELLPKIRRDGNICWLPSVLQLLGVP